MGRTRHIVVLALEAKWEKEPVVSISKDTEKGGPDLTTVDICGIKSSASSNAHQNCGLSFQGDYKPIKHYHQTTSKSWFLTHQQQLLCLDRIKFQFI